MRVSIVKGDPGHRWNAKNFTIRFNGELATHVVTADEEKGYVVRYVLDEAGKPKVSGDGMHYVMETVEGQVEIDGKAEDGTSARIPKVEVERKEDGVVHVYVYSRVKQGAIRHTAIDTKTREFRASLATEASAVNICAGAAAEHCIGQYGDVFEPSDAAMLATQKYEEMLSMEKQLKERLN